MFIDNSDRRILAHTSLGLISIIIPTKNSSKTIEKCLQSINNQTYKQIEVLVVDDFSSDATKQIAQNFGAMLISFAGERTRAKNRGIMEAIGEFLLFIDSDMILEPHVLTECIAACSKDTKVAGVIIPERSIGLGFWVKVRDFERGMYAHTPVESARFFRKNLVKQVNGFDEDIVFYEESTLPQKLEKLGFKIDARTDSVILHNEDNFNLRKWLSKKRYYSKSKATYASRYPSYNLKQSSIIYRSKLFLGKGKWKALLKHPLLGCGLFVLKFLELIFQKI